MFSNKIVIIFIDMYIQELGLKKKYRNINLAIKIPDMHITENVFGYLRKALYTGGKHIISKMIYAKI